MSTKPRVWLATGAGTTPDPVDRPVVRDNRMVTWRPDVDRDGLYRTVDGLHHATWSELHTRFDLVEVPRSTGGTPCLPGAAR